MDLGKQIRLNRIFAHPSGRVCTVAVDHFIGYQKGLPKGLANVPETIGRLVEGRPDAITMLKGMALHAWPAYAGRVPLILQSTYFTADDAILESCVTPEEALCMGADAIAVAGGVRGPNEGLFFTLLAQAVREAQPIGLPVITHIYPRDYSGAPKIVFDPENIMWAVRAGIEGGADIIKVPFTGDTASFRDIVATSPVPVVAAGGPQCATLGESLEMMAKVVASGARGATIGRNIWGAPDPTRALLAFKAVIHDGVSSNVALKRAGLPADA